MSIAKNVKLLVKRQNEEEWFNGLSEAEQEAVVKACVKTRSRAEKGRLNARRFKNEAQLVKWAQSTGRKHDQKTG